MNAEDLLASVFPDQVACAENLSGELEIPEHPLVRQTLRDCLEEAMDIDRLEDILRRLENGQINVIARDLTQPSPLRPRGIECPPLCVSGRCADRGETHPGSDGAPLD